MPQVEYLLLGEYIRQDSGVTHIMAAGLDTLYVPPGRLPVRAPIGVLARISFDRRDQVGAEHEVSLIFHGPGEVELLRVDQRLQTPPPPAGIPEHWRTNTNFIFRVALPIPSHSDDYRLEVVMDNDPLLSRSVYLRAVAAEDGQN